MQLYDPNSRKYWDDLFKDTDYYDQYKSIWTKYETETPWTFWGWLTGQNATNQYKHDMSRQDELVALHQKMYDENYMSYKNQAQEMRDAGMNPDLSGVSPQAGSVGAMNRAGIPDGQAANPLGIVGSIASSLMSVVGIASEIYGTYAKSLELDNMKIDNAQKMDSYALSYVLDNVEPRSVVDGSLADDVRVDLIDSSRNFARKYYSMNNRQSRQFQNAVSRKLDSPEYFSKYYGFMSSGSSSRKSYVQDTSGSFYDDQDETMRILFGELIDAQYKSSIAESKAKKNISDYNSKYYSSLNPYEAAKAENETNITKSDFAITDRASKLFYIESRKKLYEAFKNGNTLAGIVLALLNNGRAVIDYGKSLAPGAIGTLK